MKKLALVSAIVLITIYAFAQPTRGTYGFKSGYVEYDLTGNTTGKKYLWWDDYGAKSYTETNAVTVIEMFGIKNETKQHTATIINGDNYWSVNLATKTGQKGSISAMVAYEDYSKMTDAEKEKMADDLLKELGGSKEGTENFLGCDCIITNLLGSKAWNCKGVLLKIMVETMGVTANEFAIKFDKNISVPASKFTEIPGISYDDADEFVKMMQQYIENGDLEFELEEEEEDE